MADQQQWFWERLARSLVPESVREAGGLRRRRAELTVQTVFALLVWGPFFTALFYLSFDEPFSALVCALVTVAVMFGLVLMRLTGRGLLTGNFVLISVYLGILTLSSVNGGLQGPSLTWVVLLPLLALVIAGQQSGVCWLVVGVATYWIYYGLEQDSPPFSQILSVDELELLYTIALSGLTLIAFLGVRFRGDLQEWLVDELRQARDRALEASEAKSRFLARASHELRTPLTSIIGYSEMLLTRGDLDGEADDQLIEDLGRIQRAGQHLLALVDDLLDLSKVQAGRAQLSYRTVEVGELLDEVAESVEPKAAERNNEVRVECQATDRLRTDRDKLRQILVNLADNACKFTDDGTVMLRASRASGRGWAGKRGVAFEVTDTGVGMTAEELDVVFEPFEQATSASHDQRGTGLGLTVVEHFTELLDGHLDVSSRPGEGTTFRVHIPDAESAADEAP
ncbi:MAG: sensor histidine kinase [Bradymonadaceae bacterium]